MDNNDTVDEPKSLAKDTATAVHEGVKADRHIHIKEDEKIPILQSARSNPTAIGWCCYMLFTCIMYGYDGMAGAIVLSIPRWRQDYGYLYEGQWVVSAAWQVGFTAGTLLATVLGGIMTGVAVKYTGHRVIVGLAYIFTITGVFLQWYSPGRLGLFLGGKILTGIPLGVFVTVAPVYCSEVAPPSLRGIMIAAVNWSQVIGQLLGYGVMRETQAIDSAMSYRIMYAVQWGFAGVGLALLYFVPESPIRLMARNKVDAARKSVARLYPYLEIEAKIQEIRAMLDRDAELSAEAGSFKDCFNRDNRLRTLIAMSVYVIQANSGCSWVLGYMGYFFQLAGMQGQTVFDVTVGIAGVMAIGNMFSWYLIEKMGRRSTIFYGMVLCTSSLLIIGVLGSASTRSSIVFGQAALMAVWAFAYQASIGAVGYALMAEVPTSSLRGPTASLATCTSGTMFGGWALALPYMINPDEGNLGSRVAFIFFAVSVPAIVFIFFYYPETKGRSFEEIDELFYRRISPRKFAQTDLRAHDE